MNVAIAKPVNVLYNPLLYSVVQNVRGSIGER